MTDWLNPAARLLAVVAVVATAPPLALAALESYGLPMATADIEWWLQVRGWAVAIVLTGALVVLTELWLALPDGDDRRMVGGIWIGTLGVHVVLVAPLLAARLVPGTKMLDVLDVGWIVGHPVAAVYGLCWASCLDLVIIGLTLAARLHQRTATIDQYSGNPADLEAEVQWVLQSGGTPDGTAPGDVSAISPLAEAPRAPFLAECPAKGCEWSRLYQTAAKAEAGLRGHQPHCKGVVP